MGSAAGGRYPGWNDRLSVWMHALGITDPSKDETAAFAAAVSKAENRSGDAATISQPNSDGSVDIGLWQINSSHIGQSFAGPDGKPFTIESQAWLQDPNNNAKVAWAMSGGGHDWHAWCTAYSDNACGTKGGKYLERGSSAVEQYTSALGVVTSGSGLEGLLTLGWAGAGSTELTGPQPGAPGGVRTKCDPGIAVWSIGPWTVINQCQAQTLGGTALMIAGGLVMLTGTVVILFRFQGTRSAATAAAAAVPGVGPAVSIIGGRGTGPGPSRRRAAKTSEAARQRRDEDRAAAPQRAYDISKAREQGKASGQTAGRSSARAAGNSEPFPM